jgi:heterotetrameric sarcosine oxidase gamma subunit
MPEPHSALITRLRQARLGAESVVIGERPVGALMQIAGWPDSFSEAAAAIMRRLGFAGVGDFAHAQSASERIAFRIAPERILLHLPSPSDWAAAGPIDPTLTSILDLSHSRTLIAMRGAQVRDVLARVLPIDLHESEFGPGRFAQSAIHSVGVLVHCRSEGADGPVVEIYVPRSFAASVWDLLIETAAPFGYRVECG